MRKALVSVLAMLAVTAVTASPLAAADRILVGGQGVINFGPSLRVGALSGPAGVQGTMVIDNGPGFVFTIKVTCIRDLGAVVLVGGVIVQTTNPITLGHTSEVAIFDRGGTGQDLVGIAFSSSGLDSCPSIGQPLLQVTNGQFVVRRG
jgi:hypothetical protein